MQQPPSLFCAWANWLTQDYCLFWTIKGLKQLNFGVLSTRVKQWLYHTPHPQRVRETEKRNESFTCEGLQLWNEGKVPPTSPPLWQHLLGWFGNYRTRWEGYRWVFYLKFASMVTVKWGEKIIRFGNLCDLLLPDPVAEKRKEMRRMRRDVGVSPLCKILLYSYYSGEIL